MIDELPISPDPAIHPPGVYSTVAAAFALAMRNLPGQINGALGGMSLLQAGGVYAIPYVLAGSLVEMGGVNGGKLMFANNGALLSVDTKNAAGINVAALLNTFSQSSSTTKGHIRVQKLGDASKWAIYSIQSYSEDGSGFYGTAPISFVSGSAGSSFPLSAGDSVVLFFQRTGDKGDTGSLTPVLWVCDEKNGSTSGGTSVATDQRRTLNTVRKNTITGASLSSDVITLPAGTYRLSASAPAYNVGVHRASAQITSSGGSISITGQSAYSPSPSTISMAEFTVTASATVSIQHFTNSAVAGGLGVSTNMGGSNVYTDVFIEKVA